MRNDLVSCLIKDRYDNLAKHEINSLNFLYFIFQEGEGQAILCCYHAVNIYYYKYTVDGINVFAVSILLNSSNKSGVVWKEGCCIHMVLTCYIQ